VRAYPARSVSVNVREADEALSLSRRLRQSAAPASAERTIRASAAASPSVGCETVNINTATAEQIQTFPGFGPSKAAAVLEYRVRNGPFASCDELDNVSGIGPATLSGMRSCCTVR
jgi:competence protein ComEA